MQTKWNLELLFKSDNDPAINRTIAKLKADTQGFARRWSDRQDYLTDSGQLKTALDDYANYIEQAMSNSAVLAYFYLRSHQDQRDTKVKARLNQLTELSNKLRNQTEFFELNLAKIETKLRPKFIKDPLLKPYRYFLENIFAKSKYNLSLEQEQIVNLKQGPAHQHWVKMTSELLTSEQRVVRDGASKRRAVSFEELLSLMEDPRPSVRDQAAAEFNDVLAKYVEVGTNELNAILANKKIDDELRGYDRPDQARHIADAIPTKAVDTLIKVVSANNSVARDFYRFKAKLLGLEYLNYHERNLPYGRLDRRYTYRQAIGRVRQSLAKLNPELAEIFESFINNGQIDVYPAAGKMSGAYCTNWSNKQPTFILLNFTNKLRDVATLAHEVGHGLHFELTNRNQPALYCGTSLATAEVASQFFEGFVYKGLSEGADDELKLALLLAQLNDDISATFRQAAFYRFELELHSKFRQTGYLSASEIGRLFQTQMRAYMGGAVKHNPGSQNWWLYVSHFRSFFYVYSYVSGLLAAKAMQNYVKADPAFMDKVRLFLTAGESATTQDIFRGLGININQASFWQDGIDQIKADLAEAKRLAVKLKKI